MWNVALSRIILSASHSSSVTSEKYGMTQTGGNLGVWETGIQRWNVTLSVIIDTASHRTTVTGQEYCKMPTCRNLGIWKSFLQRWKICVSTSPARNSAAITSQQQCVIGAGRNHWTHLVCLWEFVCRSSLCSLWPTNSISNFTQVV